MKEQELLQAISDMMDHKLQAQEERQDQKLKASLQAMEEWQDQKLKASLQAMEERQDQKWKANLQAMEERLDKKTDAKLQAMEERLDKKTDTKLQAMEERLDKKTDTKLQAMEERLDKKTDAKLQAMADRAEIRFQAMEGRMLAMENKLTRTNMILENEIQPNIKTILDILLPLADHYMITDAKVETIETEHKLLKEIVSEHSTDIQTLKKIHKLA